MNLRHLKSSTVIIHRNERWRIDVADEGAGRTNTGDGENFGKAWEELGGAK